VDHEVKHDIDIECARREHAQAVNLEKHGLRDQRQCGAHGGIETLEVSNLCYAIVLLCRQQQFIRFVLSGGEGLFDKDVDAGLHQSASYLEVKYGGYGDGGCLYFAVRGKHLFDGAEGFAIEVTGYSIGADGVRVNDSDKPHTPCFFKVVVHAGVVASEGARADNSDIDRRFRTQKRAPHLQKECGIVAVSRADGKAQKKSANTRQGSARFFQQSDLPCMIKFVP
jgi:hypothetical protein